jgi:putative mycofactocin binding protein MftB
MAFVGYIEARRLYRLAHGVSVRKERFGLLFYNSKGLKLTFVRSGSWIHPNFFSGKLDLKKWVRTQFPTQTEEKMLRIEERLLRTLSKLVEKGLVVETVVDS